MDARTSRIVIHVTNCWYPMVGGITTTVARLTETTEKHLEVPTRVIAYPARVHEWVQSPGFRSVRRLVHGLTVGLVLGRTVAAVVRHRLRGEQVVVHSHSAAFCLVAGALSTLLGGRAVHTVSSSMFDEPRRLSWAGGLYRWAARRITAVVYCCDALRREQEALLSPGRAEVILWGVDEPPADADRASPSLREAVGEPHGVLVVWVGHLIPRKDPVLAVESLPFLEGAQLVVMGEGELREEITSRAAALRVQDRLHLLGNVPHSQYLQYLADADALLVTSQAEGLPQVIFDAMLAGTPVAATPVSGIPEMILDGETGRLIGERTGKAVATTVEELLAGSAANRMVHQARERVLARCSWPKVAEQYAALYGFADGEGGREAVES